MGACILGLSHILTVPLNVSTVPLPGASVEVKVGEGYQISCVVTGDDANTTNPWLYIDNTENSKEGLLEVRNETEAGVTVIIDTLQDTIGINSTIFFKNVTEDQLGVYTCSAGDGRLNANVTLKRPSKWNVQLNVFSLHDAADVGYRVFLGRCEMSQVQVC